MRCLLIVSSVLACQLIAADTWRFEPRHVDEKIDGCGDPKDGCVHAEFTYVEAVGGPEAARDRVNATIREYVVARPGDGLKLTPEDYAERFVADYDKQKRGQPDFQQRWSMSKLVKVLLDTGPLLCLEISEWSFTGGAHGNSGTEYLTLDAQTGHRLKLGSVLKAGALPKLTAIAEAYFRKERQIAPDADLKKEGFDLPQGRFRLNENFGFNGKKMLFFYNSYEIGPYSMGSTMVAIPMTEVNDLLRPEFRQ